MDDAEARGIIEVDIAPALRLFTSREGATLQDSNRTLSVLNSVTEKLPRDINWPEDFESDLKAIDIMRLVESQWPELSFYDEVSGSEFFEEVPESIGDALDDLGDISFDLARGIEMSEADAVGALSQIRFWYDTHRGPHSANSQRHLHQKITP